MIESIHVRKKTLGVYLVIALVATSTTLLTSANVFASKDYDHDHGGNHKAKAVHRLTVELTINNNHRGQNGVIDTYQHGYRVDSYPAYIPAGTSKHTMSYFNGEVDTGRFQICVGLENDRQGCSTGYNSEESRPEHMTITIGNDNSRTTENEDLGQSQAQSSTNENNNNNEQSQGQDSDANPYCDLLTDEDRGNVTCHDRQDASQTTGLYTCNDGTHRETWESCPDVSGYDYGDYPACKNGVMQNCQVPDGITCLIEDRDDPCMDIWYGLSGGGWIEGLGDPCYNKGYEDGLDHPYNHETSRKCGDTYHDAFIEGCMSVEGNTKDICESATDA